MSPRKQEANWRNAAAVACGLVFFTAGGWALDRAVLSGVVTRVIDGDTLTVQLSTGPVTVQLAYIDAPELSQTGGGAATRALHERLVGQEVSLDVVARDGEDRIVAVASLAGENVNAWMVKQGHAWARRDGTDGGDYCAWEHAARSLHRGLWTGKRLDWVAPWDFRETRRDPLFFVTDYSGATTASCMREVRQPAAFDD
jgi:endonuclease YncB( thermonuclease family)